MDSANNTWVIVLAAGAGTRVQNLTRDSRGNVIPKQFYRFHGDRTLLDVTLDRAKKLTAPSNIVVIVAQEHERFWRGLDRELPQENIIVQPLNRGTAVGLLLPLLHIIVRDPVADVVVLPSDHHIEDEAIVRRAIDSALPATRFHISLFGLQPSAPDKSLGWIVCKEERDSGPRAISSFVEKPDAATAVELWHSGALWNSFIMSGRARSFLYLYAKYLPKLASIMGRHVVSDWRDSEALHQLYEALPVNDFSRDVLQKAVDYIQVVEVPACGWSDLGTEERFLAGLAKVQSQRDREGRPSPAHVSASAL